MIPSDEEWLGEEASAGSKVRAGLGILMATGDWTWWHHPSAATTVMLNAVNPSGIVEWGGDPAVMLAHEWLDISTALEVANAFNNLLALRNEDLRLKINRSVYLWRAISNVDAIFDDISLASSQKRVFSEWPMDRRPRRKAVSRTQENDLIIAASKNIINLVNFLVESMSQGQWMKDGNSADIAVGEIEYFINYNLSAELLIILDDDKNKLFSNLDSIRISTGAQCAIFLPIAQDNIDVWFNIFGRELVRSNSIDAALAEANKNIVFGAAILASTQKFVVQSHQYFSRPSFEEKKVPKRKLDKLNGESPVEYGSAVAYKNAASPNLEIEEMRMRAKPPSIRVLDASVMKDDKVIKKFPPFGIISIFIKIIPLTPLHDVGDIFPDDEISWVNGEKLLEIHMFEVASPPVTMPFRVTKKGKSNQAEFKYFVKTDVEIDLRFVVSEGARILQTARMQSKSDNEIIFFVESLNTPVEQEKKKFDIALLVNDSLGNKSSATVLTDQGVNLTLMEGTELDASRIKLRSILESCVNFVDVSLAETLFDLANHGKMLFDGLKHQTKGWPEKIERVQLTTPLDVYFPLEYLYDGDIPENIDQGLCIERANCLNKGLAKENCAIRSAGIQLCPMGFLGITAIIERQTWQQTMDKTMWLNQSRDLLHRHNITDLGRAVFAASDKADEFRDDELSPFFEPVRIKDIEKQIGVRKTNWTDWRQTISENQPKLLVLIPHIENSHLYIGANQKIAFAAIQRRHLGNSEPVVVAIGCNSAIGIASTMGLPAVLIRQGARIVIGSLTGVLGRYANIATKDLTMHLLAASSSENPIAVGTLLTELRRKFLAKDNALGLVLIAFGDADYTLGGRLEK